MRKALVFQLLMEQTYLKNLAYKQHWFFQYAPAVFYYKWFSVLCLYHFIFIPLYSKKNR